MSDRLNLTEARIKALPVPGQGRLQIYDEDVRQLMLRLTHAGVRTWYVSTWSKGRQRWISLGRWPAIPLAAARTLARETLVALAKGADPVAQKREEAAMARGGRVPLLDAAERHVVKLTERARSPTHLREIERVAKAAHEAGVRDLADPGVAVKADRWLQGLSISPMTRNRFRRHLIAIGKTAVRWWPATVLPREPFLALGGQGAPLPMPPVFTPAEAARLVSDQALASVHTGGPLWAFLLYTGCRLREGTWARWDRVDLMRRLFLVVPPTEVERQQGAAVKRNKARQVGLHPELVGLLRGWQAAGESSADFLFPAGWRAAGAASLMRAFHRHLDVVGIPLEGRHIHSLRHTHACIALAAGVDSLLLRLSLGHGGPEMTAHYAAQSMRWRGLLASWNGELRLRDQDAQDLLERSAG